MCGYTIQTPIANGEIRPRVNDLYWVQGLIICCRIAKEILIIARLKSQLLSKVVVLTTQERWIYILCKT